MTSDFCVIDGEHYFIRGIIEIPLIDTPGRFAYGVWVTQKKENFITYFNHRDTKDIGPFFGWLSTQLPGYSQDTINLKTMAHFQGDGLRPRIELEDIDHPLCIEQKQGISIARAWEIVHFYSPEVNES